jgi:putative aldouronate transport system permease protein
MAHRGIREYCGGWNISGINSAFTGDKMIKKTNGGFSIRYLQKEKVLYLMVLPGIIYFFIYKYIPMLGLTISFQDYNPGLGFLGSRFAGLKHFKRFFTDMAFLRLFRNTLLISLYNLIFYFPLPVIFALLMNEIRKLWFKKIVQTITYLPHFVSWVVIFGMTYNIFTVEGGIVNYFLEDLFGFKIPFLTSERWFRSLIILQNIWRECGWGTIIFLAAITGIDPQLYEASEIDGASRIQKIWHITLPCIRSTIITLLILRMGRMLDTGFEQIFLMLNSMNREVGEVFDTYAYRIGIQQGQFSYSTVIGMFKSTVSLVLVLLANFAAKKAGEEGIY